MTRIARRMYVNNHYYPYFNRYNNRQGTEYDNRYSGYRQISIEEAMNIAVGRVPGQIVKVELEKEQGVWVYEVEIITAQGVKYEVEVDMNTGNIVKIEVD
ncbi:PepSY domain-containing protein [Oceanobacillus alkalisoli]|uniref:PepSY domain-containing protein n=1 Tax=Oceanobacillus alkalisoli TaxID=2925113 RepID=UPI001EE45ABD|nr:PepSY domain-containing protein [Oceanobacillus alkalisoli]MCG5103234.1 PepSY domain-containing protein [Oceanobacillus alkalisoli]